MKSETTSPFLHFVHQSKPLNLLAGILTYALGVGIAQFLGHPIRWEVYWLGQAGVTMLQLSSFYLSAYYDPLNIFPSSTDQTEKKETKKELPRLVFLQAAVTTLTVGAVLSVLLFANGVVNLAVLFILGVAFCLSFFYAVPPFKLAQRGYGDLINAFFVANLIPALAYLLQTGDFHRLLAMLTFPLTALFLAAEIATSLKSYATDLKFSRRTLPVSLGWQQAMNLHNLLILGAYLLFGTAAIIGLPWRLTWPGLLTLPLGIWQIWLMSRIIAGDKPRWNLIDLLALGLVAVTAYSLTITLWTG
jgi:1,4-dihydroxy-2-naphthoate polyprenyltransferase